jgi:hypothetical protein
MATLKGDQALVDFLKGPGNAIFQFNQPEQWEHYEIIKRVIHTQIFNKPTLQSLPG